jgi:hypothetical protein
MQRTSVLVYIHNKTHVITIIVQRTRTPSYTKTENQRPFPPHTRSHSRPSIVSCTFSVHRIESRISDQQHGIKECEWNTSQSIFHQQKFRSSESSQTVMDDSLVN